MAERFQKSKKKSHTFFTHNSKFLFLSNDLVLYYDLYECKIT